MYIPGILVAPFSGAIIDKFNKKHIIIASDTIAALGSLGILVMFNMGVLNRLVIYLVVLIKSICSSFQAPAFQAGISQMVHKEDFGRAIGLANVGESINKIVSPLLGGMLYYSLSLGNRTGHGWPFLKRRSSHRNSCHALDIFQFSHIVLKHI